MPSGTKQNFSRADVGKLVDRAIEENGSVIIKRPGRKDLVILPLERLREIDTTEYLLASPKNRKRLLGALRESKAGKGEVMTVSQLRKRVGLSR